MRAWAVRTTGAPVSPIAIHGDCSSGSPSAIVTRVVASPATEPPRSSRMRRTTLDRSSRTEERRGGKEGGSAGGTRWAPSADKKKQTQTEVIGNSYQVLSRAHLLN